jgi:hypothetical protein
LEEVEAEEEDEEEDDEEGNARTIAECPAAPALWPPLHDPDRGRRGHMAPVSPEDGQSPQAPERRLRIARTGGAIPAGGATERNLFPPPPPPPPPPPLPRPAVDLSNLAPCNIAR